MITSAQNTQVKNIIKLNQKAKARREQKLFVAEGRKMFLEAPENLIDRIYVAESMLEDEEVMQKVRRFAWEAVENSVFRQMCDTQTPQGILTVLRQPSYQMEDLLREKNPLVMVLEDLQDPGNAGTIIRTGEGAGVSGVFLTKTCVDITNPKVIRATMGSVYRIPFLYVEDVVSLKQQLQDRGIRFFAAHLQGKNSYDREDYRGGTAFLIGNEGKGLTEQAAEAADSTLRDNAWSEVLSASEVKKYPEEDVNAAIDEYKASYETYIEEIGIEMSDFLDAQGMTQDDFDEQCKETAQARVEQNMIVQEIMNKEGLSIDDDADKINSVLYSEYGLNSEDEIKDAYYLSDQEIAEEKALICVKEFIVANATVEEKTGSEGDLIANEDAYDLEGGDEDLEYEILDEDGEEYTDEDGETYVDEDGDTSDTEEEQ